MILDDIVASVRADLAGRVASAPLERVVESALATPAPRDFAGSLRSSILRPALIAEVKRASPSRGVIRPGLDARELATAYADAGAAAISVLTEPRYFQGSLDDLRAVASTVARPVLRKDFVVDPYQVYEARAAGAAAILLIARVLGRQALADLLGLATSLSLAPLVEVHDAADVESALAAGAGIIGVNNRDLATFRVDLDVTARLRRLVPADRLLVSESGIGGPADLRRALEAGADAVLIGETLVRAGDVGAAIRALYGLPA